MYIATVPNRYSPPAILLRESFRDHGKVRSRTLANLTHWAPTRVEAFRRVLRGDFDQLPAYDPTLGPVFGLLFVLKQIADALGLTAALGRPPVGANWRCFWCWRAWLIRGLVCRPYAGRRIMP